MEGGMLASVGLLEFRAIPANIATRSEPVSAGV